MMHRDIASEVHAPSRYPQSGLRELSAGTILGLLKACDRATENVRITIRHDGWKVPRVVLLPASLSRHVIGDIIAQNIADALPDGASAITIERVARLNDGRRRNGPAHRSECTLFGTGRPHSLFAPCNTGGGVRA